MTPPETVDEIFAEWDKPDSPGCALGVVQDNRLVYAHGYGMANLDYDLPITPSSVFHVASVSKQFAAMAIALLAQEGRSPSTPISIRIYRSCRIRRGHHSASPHSPYQRTARSVGDSGLSGWREHDVFTNAMCWMPWFGSGI